VTPVEAATSQKEVTLTTIGRKSGNPRKVTIWIVTDGERLFVRSGQGFRRDWPQNLRTRGEATLQLGGQPIKVKPRHVSDPDEARAVSQLVRKKYGFTVKASRPGEAPTLGEQATFELIPVD
jgi:deazaflavin-dependent oxidoreductase (nitroreductase family)